MRFGGWSRPFFEDVMLPAIIGEFRRLNTLCGSFLAAKSVLGAHGKSAGDHRRTDDDAASAATLVTKKSLSNLRGPLVRTVFLIVAQDDAGAPRWVHGAKTGPG
jgi:hypothetical protein